MTKVDKFAPPQNSVGSVTCVLHDPSPLLCGNVTPMHALTCMRLMIMSLNGRPQSLAEWPANWRPQQRSTRLVASH